MSLATNVQNLATRVATELKSLRILVNGNASDLSALTTTNKSNLVVAVNEVKNLADAAAGGGVAIDDGTVSSSTTYSSSKIHEVSDEAADAAVQVLVGEAPEVLDTIYELAQALGDDPNFATTITSELSNRVRFDEAQSLNAGERLQARTNIAAAGSTEVGDTEINFVDTFEAGLA